MRRAIVLTDWRQRVRRLGLLLLGLVLLLLGRGYARYPGFARDAALMASAAKMSDIAELYSYMFHYTGYFSRISGNPDYGYYDLEGAVQDVDRKADPFEYGMLSYREGTLEDVTFSSGLLPGPPTQDELLCTCMSVGTTRHVKGRA